MTVIPKKFHQFSSARRRRNLIKKPKDNNNAWVEGNDNLKPMIFDYFQNLFLSDAGLIDENLLNTVKRVVTGQMNDILIAPYTREEVKKRCFK